MSTMSYSPEALTERINGWLSDFSARLSAGDQAGLAALFTPKADWRDLVSFTWSFTSVYDAEEIAASLIDFNQQTGARDFRVDEDRTAPKQTTRAGEAVIEAIYSFRTNAGRGAGVLRLVEAAGGELKASALLTTLQELDGFEEQRGARRPHGTAYSRTFGGDNWADLRRKSVEYTDRDPEVLIVGAGQAGLGVAARLNTIGVDALLVEALPRVGDVWRNRYHSLTLHNEAWVASFPYLEFPDTWPTYIPKDKLAGWFEFYAEAMELNVWTSTTFDSGEYDEATGTWTAVVTRNGEKRTLRPKHIIVCTGSVSGVLNIPQLPGLDTFKGDVTHSSQYTSGTQYQNRKALVIGTGTSGHDVAQDLHALGSQATIVQRQSTTVVGLEPSGVMVYSLYKEGLPLEDADLIGSTSTMRALIRSNQLMVPKMLEADKEILDRLHAVGFRTDEGEDNTGFHLKYNRRGGGYYINVGASDLIADGEIGLLQYDEIDTFVPEGVKLKNGEIMELDLVVLATGYRNQQEEVRRWFGDEIADRLGPIWGVDEDDEMRNVWRPTAQPGLWFHTGSLAANRIYSKYLSLLIKSELEGVKPETAKESAHA